MRTILIAYIATAVVFFAMDFVWLSTATSWLYRPRLGAMLLDKPNLPVAALFYLVYVVGILAFAVMPALEQGDWVRALWGGALAAAGYALLSGCALLGVVAYGT